MIEASLMRCLNTREEQERHYVMERWDVSIGIIRSLNMPVRPGRTTPELVGFQVGAQDAKDSLKLLQGQRGVGGYLDMSRAGDVLCLSWLFIMHGGECLNACT